MFKWFDKWLASRTQKGMMHLREGKEPSSYVTAVEDNYLRSSRKNAMHFKIYRASGGHVLEYQKYNDHTDEDDNTLHIIPSDADLGKSLAHIITLELLRT